MSSWTDDMWGRRKSPPDYLEQARIAQAQQAEAEAQAKAIMRHEHLDYQQRRMQAEMDQREQERKQREAAGIHRYFPHDKTPTCETCIFADGGWNGVKCLVTGKGTNLNGLCAHHPTLQAVAAIVKEEAKVEYVKQRIGVDPGGD